MKKQSLAHSMTPTVNPAQVDGKEHTLVSHKELRKKGHSEESIAILEKWAREPYRSGMDVTAGPLLCMDCKRPSHRCNCY